MKLICSLAFRFVSALIAALLWFAAPGLAENPLSVVSTPGFAGQPDSTEMEQTLYVQAPDFAGAHDAIDLVWLPEPLVSTCLGKTMKQCFTIDFCIRTTNPNDARCKNLGIPRARLPHYPPGMQPSRAIDVTLIKSGDNNGLALLKDFYRRAPKDSLARLSSKATIRARIRYTRTASNEGFYLLQVLSVPKL